MPIHEFRCSNDHLTERLFLTFAAVDELENYGLEDPTTGDLIESGKYIRCPQCEEMALMQMSVPFPGHFYGNPEGYQKPSPTKRHSTKLVSAKEGNRNSIG
jgi:DNA-directed RNA polymerase subunit RPC12/RpoP